jgi:hypothetical protein
LIFPGEDGVPTTGVANNGKRGGKKGPKPRETRLEKGEIYKVSSGSRTGEGILKVTPGGVLIRVMHASQHLDVGLLPETNLIGKTDAARRQRLAEIIAGYAVEVDENGAVKLETVEGKSQPVARLNDGERIPVEIPELIVVNVGEKGARFMELEDHKRRERAIRNRDFNSRRDANVEAVKALIGTTIVNPVIKNIGSKGGEAFGVFITLAGGNEPGAIDALLHWRDMYEGKEELAEIEKKFANRKDGEPVTFNGSIKLVSMEPDKEKRGQFRITLSQKVLFPLAVNTAFDMVILRRDHEDVVVAGQNGPKTETVDVIRGWWKGYDLVLSVDSLGTVSVDSIMRDHVRPQWERGIPHAPKGKRLSVTKVKFVELRSDGKAVVTK